MPSVTEDVQSDQGNSLPKRDPVPHRPSVRRRGVKRRYTWAEVVVAGDAGGSHPQLRRIEWQPHRPQHALNRIRDLDRSQQATNPTAIWAREDLHLAGFAGFDRCLEYLYS